MQIQKREIAAKQLYLVQSQLVVVVVVEVVQLRLEQMLVWRVHWLVRLQHGRLK